MAGTKSYFNVTYENNVRLNVVLTEAVKTKAMLYLRAMFENVPCLSLSAVVQELDCARCLIVCGVWLCFMFHRV